MILGAVKKCCHLMALVVPPHPTFRARPNAKEMAGPTGRIKNDQKLVTDTWTRVPDELVVNFPRSKPYER